jgi:hypothetical protein
MLQKTKENSLQLRIETSEKEHSNAAIDFTFKKWQCSITPGVLNVFTVAPRATTK